MRTAREIYEAYDIMPNLRLHQLRVAAVGKIIAESMRSVDIDEIVLACLFHDMGNILKFDLSKFPEALEPEGREYWEHVKMDFKKKYGKEQHHASMKIAAEIGLPQQVVAYIGDTGFAKMQRIVESRSYELKILEYADSRVTPYGVRSMRERWEDGRKRYLARMENNGKVGVSFASGVIAAPDDYETLVELGHELERQIFAHASIKPEDITDEAVAPVIEELWEYPVD
ncbi:MAG: hypothetical protein RLZZ416_254 [Candidatus Parcubacteria bacterium]|jgi:hypothetical protein